jgi:SAM-dependent methyltransferase
MIRDREKQTIEYYDQNAEKWVGLNGGRREVSYWVSEMERFHELLPVGRVLEIGSGAGNDAFALTSLGYDYIGIDASSGLLIVAQERNPQATFKNISVYDLDFPEKSFDGFWCVATLLHLPKDRIDEAMRRIKTQVKEGGIGFISMKQGEGEVEDSKSGRLYSYYSEGEFREVLERNGFKVIEEKTRQGEKEIWLCYWIRT